MPEDSHNEYLSDRALDKRSLPERVVSSERGFLKERIQPLIQNASKMSLKR